MKEETTKGTSRDTTEGEATNAVLDRKVQARAVATAKLLGLLTDRTNRVEDNYERFRRSQ